MADKNSPCETGCFEGVYLEIPDGWYKTFAEDFCLEVQNLYDSLPEDNKKCFSVIQVKEKFGELRFYFASTTEDHEKFRKISRKYEEISLKTCAICGEKATKMTASGWILPLCSDCAEKYFKNSKIIDNGYL